MEDYDQNAVTPESQQDITVFVTGFGPFQYHTVNASYLIASSLPSIVTLPSPKEDGVPPALRKIHIHAHPDPIPVSYSAVRTQLSAILDEYTRNHGGKRPDLILHLGIASIRNFYAVEKRAHRDCYMIPDIDGKTGYEDGESIWKKQGLPYVLQPGPEIPAAGAEHTTASPPIVTPCPPDDGLLKTWKSLAPDTADLRLSDDASRFLCEFIFYTSLASAFLAGRPRSVLFLHVPSRYDEAHIETGKEVAIALIKALATCWILETPPARTVN